MDPAIAFRRNDPRQRRGADRDFRRPAMTRSAATPCDPRIVRAVALDIDIAERCETASLAPPRARRHRSCGKRIGDQRGRPGAA